MFMSWNPGAGARKLAEIIDTRGYHVVAVQEARDDYVEKLPGDRWSYVCKFQQFIGARLPNTVESHTGVDVQGRVRWHFATVHFPTPRVGRTSLGVLSIHLNNVLAKKPVAGCIELGRTIDQATQFSANMARWSKQHKNEWHECTLEELEKRRFLPVADYVNECCCVAVHERLMQTLSMKGSSWGERPEKLQGSEQKEAFHASFLEQVGARHTSQDVHWPMSLALRMALSGRASGLRQRSAAAAQRRNEKKQRRGYGPFGRSSGSRWGGGWVFRIHCRLLC